jgi:hypothetical protein
VVAQTDPTRASALFNRAISYVDRAIRPLYATPHQ